MSASPSSPARRMLAWAPARRRDRVTDALLVLLLAGLNAALVPTWSRTAEFDAAFTWPLGGYLAGCALAALMAARRRLPLTVLVCMSVGGVAAEAAGAFVWGVAGPGIAVASYAVGRHLPLARSLGSLGVGVAVDAATTLASPAQPPTDMPGATPYLLTLVWMGGAWWVGRLVRMRTYDTAELRERARRLERARDAHVRAVLAEERSRIARELHDVVAHHVSVMTVQATAGRRVIHRSPETAEQALTDIEETGRQALAEMRRIVGVLRMAEAPEDGGAERGPQPGAADLDALAAHLREAGLGVDLEVRGKGGDPSPAQGLTLYRVVQESLTNVLKHAGEGARARVVVDLGADAVTVEVTDDGGRGGRAGRGGPGPRPPEEPGHGLLGMRERVSLFGGHLETGPTANGGFRVRADIPHNRPA
ncbi:sensor histidine kinase [Nocardiopsis suaedae]|uniref:histidine kinase n=1 Tax=Nocardiopsis suaedae TaxID=3018444 RepID=A0ABT4TVM1_9ACTN|nr:histidine kinase [Nocardiopsis suaedae]MDA2808749.1 histidine kinase [Nocardiopsis suaedae]